MNLERKIIRESFWILILASIISALGGIGLQAVKEKIFLALPLLIIFPALNGMVGNFGVVFASKYTTLLYEKKISKKNLWNKALKRDYYLMLRTSLISAFYISALASIISLLRGFELTPIFYLKIFIITSITSVFLISLTALISVPIGRYFFRKKEDPDNILIPITTSIADLGSMMVFSLLVYLFF